MNLILLSPWLAALSWSASVSNLETAMPAAFGAVTRVADGLERRSEETAAVREAEEGYVSAMIEGHLLYLEHCEILNTYAAAGLAADDRARFAAALEKARAARAELLSLGIVGSASRQGPPTHQLIARYRELYQAQRGRIRPLGEVLDGFRPAYLFQGKRLEPGHISAVNGFDAAVRELMYSQPAEPDEATAERSKMIAGVLDSEDWSLAEARKNVIFTVMMERLQNQRLESLQAALEEARDAAKGVPRSPWMPR